MTIFIIILLLFGMLIYVLEPFITRKKLPHKFASGDEIIINELRTRKNTLRSSLNDLEQEYGSGMVAGDDYRTLHDDYIQRLENIDRELSGYGSKASGLDINSLIEEEVKKYRKVDVDGVVVELLTCSQCGTEIVPESKFCSQCGSKVNESS